MSRTFQPGDKVIVARNTSPTHFFDGVVLGTVRRVDSDGDYQVEARRARTGESLTQYISGDDLDPAPKVGDAVRLTKAVHGHPAGTVGTVEALRVHEGEGERKHTITPYPVTIRLADGARVDYLALSEVEPKPLGWEVGDVVQTSAYESLTGHAGRVVHAEWDGVRVRLHVHFPTARRNGASDRQVTERGDTWVLYPDMEPVGKIDTSEPRGLRYTCGQAVRVGDPVRLRAGARTLAGSAVGGRTGRVIRLRAGEVYSLDVAVDGRRYTVRARDAVNVRQWPASLTAAKAAHPSAPATYPGDMVGTLRRMADDIEAAMAA